MGNGLRLFFAPAIAGDRGSRATDPGRPEIAVHVAARRGRPLAARGPHRGQNKETSVYHSPTAPPSPGRLRRRPCPAPAFRSHSNQGTKECRLRPGQRAFRARLRHERRRPPLPRPPPVDDARVDCATRRLAAGRTLYCIHSVSYIKWMPDGCSRRDFLRRSWCTPANVFRFSDVLRNRDWSASSNEGLYARCALFLQLDKLPS
jgi:hypothetical protein